MKYSDCIVPTVVDCPNWGRDYNDPNWIDCIDCKYAIENNPDLIDRADLIV